MKAHIGVDSKTKLIHAVAASAANVHDKHALPHLLHGRERRVYGDTGYAGQKTLLRQRAPHAKDFTQRRGRGYRYLSPEERAKNRTKSRVRAKVEHAIGASNASSALPKCATAAWPRTRIACS